MQTPLQSPVDLSAKDYFEAPALLTLNELTFLVGLAAAPHDGGRIPAELGEIFTKHMMLGFAYFTVTAGMPRAYLSSSGEYLLDLFVEKVGPLLPAAPPDLQLIDGGLA